MNGTARLAATVALSLGLGLVAPSAVRGQDAKPAPKPSPDLDRELDESLRKAHGDPNKPAPPPYYKQEELGPTQPPAEAPVAVQDTDENRFRWRLGALGAHWAARLYGVSVSKSRNGDPFVRLDLDHGSTDFETAWGFSETQAYRGWIDLGELFSIDGGYRSAVFRRDGLASHDGSFGNMGFIEGDELHAKFEFRSADLNLVVHPLNGYWGQLDIYLGARYLWSNVKIQNQSFFGDHDQQSIEAVLPMIGLGGAVRPIHFAKDTYLEIFARARVGAIDFQNDLKTREFYALSVDAEAGLTLMIYGFAGITVGYRFEFSEMERREPLSKKYAGWKSDGPFGGGIIQF